MSLEILLMPTLKSPLISFLACFYFPFSRVHFFSTVTASLKMTISYGGFSGKSKEQIGNLLSDFVTFEYKEEWMIEGIEVRRGSLEEEEKGREDQHCVRGLHMLSFIETS